MERLSIQSFLAHGHTYHLYAFEEIEGVPPGTVLRDAREILPADRIFRYTEHNSYAGFANFFRYKLLLERGGWWADSDTICLKPFDFSSEYVFSSELAADGGCDVVNLAVMKAPAGSPALAYAWDVCQSKDPRLLKWGETGPRLAGEMVRQFGLERYVKPASAFCPVPYLQWEDILDPQSSSNVIHDSYGVHLWNELWRRGAKDKNATYDPACIYERLKRQYGIASSWWKKLLVKTARSGLSS